jgi:hypothetical protein
MQGSLFESNGAPTTGGQVMTAAYSDFLSQRSQVGSANGFTPNWMPDFLYDFQGYLCDWGIRKGRAGIFSDCGSGKTAMQLVCAQNVVRHTNKPALILTPLAVGQQTVSEAEKFGIEAARSRDGSITADIVVTNYERLHYFDRHKFSCVVCDESSAIKNFDGKRTGAVIDFLKPIPYRFLCTATAAPNDYFELGTSSEALGYLGFRDMITTFFKQETSKDHLGWGRTKYRFRGHAEKPFWRWVCSWARAMRKPSDFGFDDSRFQLPPLNEIETVLESSTPRPGMLFSIPARSMQEERQERRVTIQERCERVAEMCSHDRPAVVWCHLNDEGDLLEKLIPDSKQVKGSMGDDEKEETLAAFSSGKLRKLITKPKIGCWGLNWQHCSDVYTFPSHSFEQYYQAIRRCWRFGQRKPVNVHVIATAGEAGVTKNLQRKAAQTDRLFSYLVECMNDELRMNEVETFPEQEKLPKWL